MIKRILTVFIVISTIAIIPVYAVKWENFGTGLDIYVDTDSIKEEGNKMTVVHKYSDDTFLKIFNTHNEKNKPLSVCLIQSEYDCSTGKNISGAMLCYDKAGDIAIDEPNMNTNDKKPNPGICQELRDMKKLDK